MAQAIELAEARERQASHQRRHVGLKKAMISAYKAERGCRNCGEDDPRCLDLHHVEPKNPKLKATKPGRHWWKLTWDEIPVELEKCIVLCANCHRKEHGSTI